MQIFIHHLNFQKMKSSIVFTFKLLPQAEKAEFAANVITKMTADPQFISLLPQVENLKTAYEVYQVAASKASDGGKAATLEKNTKLEDMVYQLSTVARYVDVMANESEAIVLAAGFATRKKPVAVTSLTTPTQLEATNAEKDGSAFITWGAVAGANMYAIEKRVKGTEEWLNGDYRGGKSALLEGLESNVLIEFRVRGIHISGIKSNWSQPVQVLVS